MAHIPDRILNELRCSRCQSFLSCGQVAILSNGDSLCGRCTIPGSNIFRAHAYEAIALYFLFPCKYFSKHCAYYLNFNEVGEHEEKCAFKSVCSIMCSNPGALFKSENKLDLTQTIKLFNVPEQVLELLTCSTCEYYLSSSPIFVNNEGNSSCHRCFNAKGQVPNGLIQQFALEKILEIMLFPCMYRHRGCTQYFRFGIDTTAHEYECSYGKVQRKSMKTIVDGKEKGVVENHRGHTYGTITPYTQLFVGQGRVQSTEVQDVFFNQLKKHRQNLEHKWKHKQGQNDPQEANSDRGSPNQIQMQISHDSQNLQQQQQQQRHQAPYGYEGYNQNPNYLQTRTSNDSSSRQQQPFRYSEYGQNPSPSYLQTQVSNDGSQLYPDSPFSNSQQAYRYPEAYPRPSNRPIENGRGSSSKLMQYGSRSGSRNSQNSSDSSAGNFPQQLQVPKLSQNDVMYSNSFSYFDRFERPSYPQRSDSLMQNQPSMRNSVVLPQMSDSMRNKNNFNIRNGMAAVHPPELHYGGSFRY